MQNNMQHKQQQAKTKAMRQMIKREMLKKPRMSTSNSNHSLRLKEPEEEVVAGVDCGRREGVGVDICIGELRDCL